MGRACIWLAFPASGPGTPYRVEIPPEMKRQQLHMNSRRAKGLCEYGGCKVQTGEKRRCDEHAKAHAARMKANRKKQACACGATPVDARGCTYYKSGLHVWVAA